MKKLIPMMLVLALLLCACGGGSSNLPSGTITTDPPDTAPAATESSKTMSLGRIEGGTYANAYAGFAIDLDSTWTYYTAEELQEIPENVSELFAGTELEEGVLTTITDMAAESAEHLASINVLYQKLDMGTRLAYAAMSDEQILDAVLEQSDTLIETYAQAGMVVTSIEKTTATFLGEEVPAMLTLYTLEDIPCYCLQVFDYHLGQYSCTITFTSYLEDTTAELAAMCYPIEE